MKPTRRGFLQAIGAGLALFTLKTPMVARPRVTRKFDVAVPEHSMIGPGPACDFPSMAAWESATDTDLIAGGRTLTGTLYPLLSPAEEDEACRTRDGREVVGMTRFPLGPGAPSYTIKGDPGSSVGTITGCQVSEITTERADPGTYVHGIRCGDRSGELTSRTSIVDTGF